MQTVWESCIFSSSFVSSIIICILIIAICIIISIRINGKHSILVRCTCGIVVFMILLIAANGVASTCNEWKYAQLNHLVIEGTIENFVSGANGAESFTVSGVSFSYPFPNNLVGYDTPKRERGSVITGEGQYVRLTYYRRSGINIIIKIETYDDNDYQTEIGMCLG